MRFAPSENTACRQHEHIGVIAAKAGSRRIYGPGNRFTEVLPHS
jgi:hypothetical protein